MMPRDPKPKKTEYKTLSIPSDLAEAINELNDAMGFWPSLGAFVREAAIKKIWEERRNLKMWMTSPTLEEKRPAEVTLVFDESLKSEEEPCDRNRVVVS